MPHPFDVTEDCARELDRLDPLHDFRSRFHLPADTIYMDGNSLGLASIDAELALQRRLTEWKTLGIRGWLEAEPPWFTYAEDMGERCAGLVGAEPDELVFTGTTTVNIHTLIATFFEPQGRRRKVLADPLTFPTDLYALRDQLRLRGCEPAQDLLLVPSDDGRTLDEARIVDQMSDEVALVFLPSVLYRSGQLLDLQRLTAEAHRRGIVIGFDCSHSVGAVPHRLHDWDVDFATWCSYKYLNGGPGCSAFLYVCRPHFRRQPGLSGWFGYVKQRQFDMALDFEHQPTAAGWQISSPGILGSATIEGALGIFDEAGIDRIREKSLALTSYLIFLADALLAEAPYDIQVGTPREPTRRSGHVALERREEAYRICMALRARGIVPDYREPNIIRFAPIALYSTFHEVWQVIHALRDVIQQRDYERIDSVRVPVS